MADQRPEVVMETRSIEFIPEEERHGKIHSLITLWFGFNAHSLTVATGMLAIVFGLNLAWAMIAIIIGHCVGALFMAFHSAQGPKLGVPQMIQSRAQFGVIGAIIPLVLVIFMYLGYFSSLCVMAGQTLAYVHVPTAPAILVSALIMVIICIVGYDLIHFIERWVVYLFILVFLFVTYFAIKLPLPAGAMSLGPVDFKTFLLVMSIYATWQISYAPYVADYSRYLPTNTKMSHTFWATYGGSVVGSVWLAIIGAVLATKLPAYIDNAALGAASTLGSLGWIVILLMWLGAVCCNPANLYGSFMSLVTTIEPFTKIKGTRKTRIIIVSIVGIVGTFTAIFASPNFFTVFENFIGLVLFFMIPWTSINLVDYYLLKHGDYSIPALFDLDGKYGRFNWMAIAVYFATVIVEIPFASTAFFDGPLVSVIGADISWIVGGIFAAVIYYVLGKNTLKKAQHKVA